MCLSRLLFEDRENQPDSFLQEVEKRERGEFCEVSFHWYSDMPISAQLANRQISKAVDADCRLYR